MTAKRGQLLAWRVVPADPYGLMVWFDPSRETVEIVPLDPPVDPGVPAVYARDDPDETVEQYHQTALGLVPRVLRDVD